VFETSVPTRPSEIERCRMERFSFTHYRKSCRVDTPQKDSYEIETLCETFELEKRSIGLHERKKIIRFWKGQEYKLYISLSVYLFPRCQSSTGVGTCDEVQIRCCLFHCKLLKVGWGSVIYRGHSCCLIVLKLTIVTIKTSVYCAAFCRAVTPQIHVYCDSFVLRLCKYFGRGTSLALKVYTLEYF